MIDWTASGHADEPDAIDALSRIGLRLKEAVASAGAIVYVEGPPATGKTRLVKATGEAARAAGVRVLQAQGRALEREFPFGVALQLFEETWFATGAGERTSLVAGPARPAGELLSGAPPAGSDLGTERVYAVIHGLFWLTRALTSNGPGATSHRPLALLVDDIDHVDGPSLRFLAYLTSRVGRLPIAIVVAGEPGGPSADPAALSALRSASEILALTSAGLGPAAAGLGPAAAAQIPSAPGAGARAVAAHAALRKSLAEGHRESVLDLAELAWGDGALLESDADADAWPAVAASLLFVDELELAVEVARAATALGRAGGPPGVARWQGWGLYHQGRVTAALAVAEVARAAHRADPVAHGLIAACRLAQGRLDEAEAALSLLSADNGVEEIDGPMLLDLRAQLRLAQLRPADALADALEAGRVCRRAWGVMGPGVVAWRSTAASARLALGESTQARSLAEEELEMARQRGLTRVVIRDLRVLAFAAKGTRVLDLLSEAVRIGRAGPPRLEYMNALIDLGAATRRSNQRTAARHPLRMGLELAEREGVAALAQRAREELGATGARSRRVMLSGLQALTPCERRVADLAARGSTTRQIAQALFVTPKTVEFHLRHVYRKLDIPSSRADLARALSTPSAG